MDKLKLLMVFWDTRHEFSVPNTLADHMLSISKKFGSNVKYQTQSQEIDLVEDITISHLDQLIQSCDHYDFSHAVVLASGCIIYNEVAFVSGIKHQIQSHPGMCVSAHILHTGLWESEKNPEFYTLHEQTFLFSNHALKQMKQDNLRINRHPGYQTEKWHLVSRSDRNVHDDYTPLDIHPKEGGGVIKIFKKSKMGVAEELINYCMKKNWHIQNFNMSVRNGKKYSYHVEQPEEFEKYLNSNPRVLDESKMIRGHFEFFKKFDYSDQIWTFNTERMIETLPDKKYDLFVGVASGHLPWCYLSSYNFLDQSKVILIDINQPALNFQKWFFKSYNPFQELEWGQVVDTYMQLSNYSALEIINDKYRIITSDSKWHGIDQPYVIKAYWQDNKYIEEMIDCNDNFKQLKELLEK